MPEIIDRYSSVTLNAIALKNSLYLLSRIFNLIRKVSLNQKASQAISKKTEVKLFISVEPLMKGHRIRVQCCLKQTCSFRPMQLLNVIFPHRFEYYINNQILSLMSQQSEEKKTVAPTNRKASLFSRLFLQWSNDYAKKCQDSQLTQQDVCEFQQSQRFAQTYMRWNASWLLSEKAVDGDSPSGERLKWTMRKTFQNQIIVSSIMSFVAHQSGALVPLVIYLVSQQISNDRISVIQSIILLLAIFCLKFMRTYLSMQSSYNLKKIGSEIFCCFCYALTQKSLKKIKYSKQQMTTSEKAKLAQFDCSKVIEYIQVYTDAAFELWCLFFTMACLFFVAGWEGFVSCFVLFTLSMVRYMMVSLFRRFKGEVNQEASIRIKKSTEAINNIKFIKVNVLEDMFFGKLNDSRSKEVSLLRKFLNLGIFATVMQHVSSRFSIIVFAFLYTLNGNPINSALVFSVLLFFHNMLLHKLMNKANSLDDINISLGKIEEFLINEQRDCSFIERDTSNQVDDSIIVRGKGFHWEKQGSKDSVIDQMGFSLSDINFRIKKGEFVALIGEFGSGKSSILNAILGEMISDSSKVTVHGKVAYASQNPWILNDSVKNNILFGEPFEQGRYKRALQYSKLETDLELFSMGDETVIGENGSTLSGGQRARISLARALYAQADIYILDDILSALDAHVSAFIFQETLAKYLKSKTIVLATHLTNYLSLVNRVFMIQDGRISQIVDKSNLMPQIFNARKRSSMPPNRLSYESNQGEIIQLQKLKAIQPVVQQGQEISQYQLFKLFIRRRGGLWYAVVTVIFMILIIATNLFLVSWLNFWVSSKDNTDSYYYEVYIMILVACQLSIGIHAIFEFNSQFFNELHRKMIRNLLAAPMTYFQTTSISDSMNKLSHDIKKVDNETVTQFRNTVFYISLGTSFIANSVITYINRHQLLMIGLVFALILIVAYYYLYFMVAIRQIHRLQQSSQIPIYSCYVEILTGAPTIRAYNKQSFVKEKQAALLENFILTHKIMAGVEAYFTFIISIFTAIITTILFVKIFVFKDQTAVDFFLIYNIYSFERTVQNLHEILFDFLNNLKYLGYCEELMTIPQEEGYDFVDVDGNEEFKPRQQSEEWMSDGRVEFKDFSVKYRPELETVLCGLSLSIKAGEKIGVVGRTGSGKSTTILSLLRILQTHEGDIEIDGTSLYSLDIQSVRAGFSVILQEHFLFSGTVRDNIDPLHQLQDKDIKQVLNTCGIWESLEAREGLDTLVEEGGHNFSAGEKQLINISRTLLNPKKIVLVDEATASIDFATDELLQKVIKERLRDSTMITIAHRIDTILTSDRILVLDQGKIAELDPPQVLLSRPESIFNKLYEEFKNVKEESSTFE